MGDNIPHRTPPREPDQPEKTGAEEGLEAGLDDGISFAAEKDDECGRVILLVLDEQAYDTLRDILAEAGVEGVGAGLKTGNA